MQVRLSEAMCTWFTQADPLILLISSRGCWCGGQTHRSCIVRRFEERVASISLARKQPRQALRFPVIVLAALEENVISLNTPVFWKVLSWWMLLQSWATLRFDDHRGMVPADLSVSEAGLVGKLTRSKVSGPDKKLNYRLLLVHSSAYVHHKHWLVSGWKLLEKEAPYLRDPHQRIMFVVSRGRN